MEQEHKSQIMIRKKLTKNSKKAVAFPRQRWRRCTADRLPPPANRGGGCEGGKEEQKSPKAVSSLMSVLLLKAHYCLFPILRLYPSEWGPPTFPAGAAAVTGEDGGVAGAGHQFRGNRLKNF